MGEYQRDVIVSARLYDFYGIQGEPNGTAIKCQQIHEGFSNLAMRISLLLAWLVVDAWDDEIAMFDEIEALTAYTLSLSFRKKAMKGKCRHVVYQKLW